MERYLAANGYTNATVYANTMRSTGSCPIELDFSFVHEDGCGTYIKVDGLFVLEDTAAPRAIEPPTDVVVEENLRDKDAALDQWLNASVWEDDTDVTLSAKLVDSYVGTGGEQCEWGGTYVYAQHVQSIASAECHVWGWWS